MNVIQILFQKMENGVINVMMKMKEIQDVYQKKDVNIMIIPKNYFVMNAKKVMLNIIIYVFLVNIKYQIVKNVILMK